LTTATGPQFVTTLMPAQAEPKTSRSGYRPVVCALALIWADCLAMFVATQFVLRGMALLWPALDAQSASGNTPTELNLTVIFTIIVLYLAAKGRYQAPMPFWTEMGLVVCASLVAAGTEVAFGSLASNIVQSVLEMAVLVVFPFLGTAANELAKRALALMGIWSFPVLVVGSGQSAMETVLESDRSLGYRIVARIDPDALLAALTNHRLWSVLDRHSARHLLIVVGGERQRQVVECALRERIPFTLASPFYAFPAFPCRSTSLFSHDTMLLSFQDGLSRSIARGVKTVVDVVGAAFLLLVTLPLFVVLVIANRLDGGPALFAHRRVGMGGQPFDCLKFRTMVVDADQVLSETLARDPALAAEWASTRKLVDDPRVTSMGHLLRRTSLDELPQLINVLRLEMSLVGPRPIVEGEIPLYGKDISLYYAMRPGLTGLWQVSGRSSVSYARRVQLDAWYVNNWTIWHDFVVLLKTIPAVFGRRGAH
jgi:Undecaprenyl-phosphate galactose phosphotransferase WbaP